MAYTTINKGSDYFITHLYSGNETTNNQSIGLTPDFVWIKCRNNASPNHVLVNKLRGDKKYINSNTTLAETTTPNNLDLVTGGFNINGGDGGWNLIGRTYASWNWVGGGTGVSNTDGSITSTISANTTSGFSIVKWTGNGSVATIGHGLNAVPKVILQKPYSTAGYGWNVYHSSLGATKYINLHSTNASGTASTLWNDTEPTSSVFTLGTSAGGNGSGLDIIAYCFAEKKGFSKFGSYSGNGNADGTFVYTGFKPAFIMVKNSTTAGPSWVILDNKRNTYNPESNYLQPNTNDAEASSAYADFLSNGFKFKSADNWVNGSGATYIYMCFAELPLVSSSGVPCTAR